jgi:tRNA (cytidine56-2'-O)-methyltransferase
VIWHLKRIVILRLGHRKRRDPRVTTHVALAARAFGAQEMFFSGDQDPELIKTMQKAVLNWGGEFSVQHVRSWKAFLNNWKSKGKSVHLTMYGIDAGKALEEIRSIDTDLLVIVGGQKVPAEVYNLVDWNISVTNQPHSEVSALAVFLHMLNQGKESELRFQGARITVVPSSRGKNVIRVNTSSLFSL